MKAGIVFAANDIRYADAEKPPVTDGTVRVNVKACGICGSDIPRALSGSAHSYPIILGHEFSGIVDEVGGGVSNVSPGDHVCGIPLIPCMDCPDCKAGNFSLCKHYSFIGSRVPGAMAEYVTVPAANVLKIDDSIVFEDAALFEPCTVAIHGLFQAGFKPGGKVAILGGGTIGLFTLQWAKLLGAESVTVIGRGKARLELSRQFGADRLISILDEGHMDEINSVTGGRGFDYVFETAGSVSAMKMAFEIAANKSTVCYIGTPKDDLVFSPRLFENLNRKEMYLTGSWMSYSAPFPGREWTMTADSFMSGDIRVIPEMVYKKYPLGQIAAAFDEFRTPGKVKGKILIVNE